MNIFCAKNINIRNDSSLLPTLNKLRIDIKPTNKIEEIQKIPNSKEKDTKNNDLAIEIKASSKLLPTKK